MPQLEWCFRVKCPSPLARSSSAREGVAAVPKARGWKSFAIGAQVWPRSRPPWESLRPFGVHLLGDDTTCKCLVDKFLICSLYTNVRFNYSQRIILIINIILCCNNYQGLERYCARNLVGNVMYILKPKCVSLRHTGRRRIMRWYEITKCDAEAWNLTSTVGQGRKVCTIAWRRARAGFVKREEYLPFDRLT